MDLTIGEYCLFNRHSRIKLLERKGILISRKRIDAQHEIKLFRLFDFYVEVIWSLSETKALKIEPVRGGQWLGFFVLNTLEEPELC